MRRKSLAMLIPAVIVAATLLATPAPVAAAGGAIEVGATTYTVNTAGNRIDVSIQLRITNNKPPDSHYFYYYQGTQIPVEVEAGTVKATSNAGAVSQSVAESDRWYRTINLKYPPVYYRQTRVINITYSIDAQPRAKGGFRAVKAFMDLCAIGRGFDSGTVAVVLPADFDIAYYSGKTLQDAGVSGGTRTYTSGTLSEPYKFWTCFDGTNPSALVTTRETIAGQKFEIQSWPEDPAWKVRIEGLLEDYIEGLQAMNGLDLPGDTIIVREVGNSELGEFAGMYNSATKIAYVTEETGVDIVAHELSHIWYNRKLFTDKWASEGLAGYSEQLAGRGEYTICNKPGKYPGTGTPNLTKWMILDMNSTTQDEQVLDYQYSAACYIITELASDMGEENLKAVLQAGAKGEMAYQGATQNEKSSASVTPLSAEAFLDMIDERGMVPGGVKDLDQAQELLAQYGIFDSAELSERSTARAAYHKLAGDAGDWKLPLAVRSPMSSWDFDEAGAAMTDATKVIGARDEIVAMLSDFSFDGTELESQFEGAATAATLGDLANLAQQEVDAAAVLADARAADAKRHDPLALIGLLGTDLKAPLNQATDALKDLRPDEAKTAAQNVLDQINGASMAGTLRLAVLLGLMVLAFLAFKLFKMLRNRRRLALAAAGAAGEGAAEAAAETMAEAVAEAEPPATKRPSRARTKAVAEEATEAKPAPRSRARTPKPPAEPPAEPPV